MSLYVRLARKQDGGSNGSTCISNYMTITELGVCVMHFQALFCPFQVLAALANEAANIARQQGQGSKVATSQNALLFFSLFSQASALTPEVISMITSKKIRKSSGVLHQLFQL